MKRKGGNVTKNGQCLILSLTRSLISLVAFFPGTATVESDFSLINWEMDEYGSWPTDLSLKGILHSKQTLICKMLSLTDGC